jgi:hypothetical protein
VKSEILLVLIDWWAIDSAPIPLVEGIESEASARLSGLAGAFLFWDGLTRPLTVRPAGCQDIGCSSLGKVLPDGSFFFGSRSGGGSFTERQREVVAPCFDLVRLTATFMNELASGAALLCHKATSNLSQHQPDELPTYFGFNAR